MKLGAFLTSYVPCCVTTQLLDAVNGSDIWDMVGNAVLATIPSLVALGLKEAVIGLIDGWKRKRKKAKR